MSDTGLKRLIELVRTDKAIQEIPLTTEEEGVARATSFCAAETIYTEAQFKAWLPRIIKEPGPIFAGVKVAIDRGEFILPPRDGAELKLRFQQALRAAS